MRWSFRGLLLCSYLFRFLVWLYYDVWHLKMSVFSYCKFGLNGVAGLALGVNGWTHALAVGDGQHVAVELGVHVLGSGNGSGGGLLTIQLVLNALLLVCLTLELVLDALLFVFEGGQVEHNLGCHVARKIKCHQVVGSVNVNDNGIGVCHVVEYGLRELACVGMIGNLHHQLPDG